MTEPSFNSRYRCLDLWRGIAALFVVIYHAGSYAAHRQTELSFFELVSTKFIQHLDIGVLIFFVISGYCISASAESFRDIDYKSTFRFFILRFRRIYPPYWMALVFAMFVGFWGLYESAYVTDEFANPLTLSFSQWFGNITLTETWLPRFTQSNSEVLLLKPSWSLCYEVQFYLLMGLMLIFRVKLLYWTILISVITLMTMFFPQIVGLQSVYRSFLDGQWLFFGIGILVFYALQFQKEKMWWWKLGLWSLALGQFIIGFIYRSDIAIYYTFSTLFGLTLIIMYSDDQYISSSAVAKPLMYCGKICYSLYLIHLPVCSFLAPKIYSWGLTSITHTMTITIPVCIIISLILAMIFYRYCEKPFINNHLVAKKEPVFISSSV